MKLQRRTFLRGITGGLSTALALPMLEAMLDTHGEALADGTALPKRFGVWFWGNGAPTNLWLPSGAGAQWTAGKALAPLDTPELKPLVTVTSGLQAVGAQGDHYSSKSSVLSGEAAGGVPGGGGSAPASPSADQLAADHLGAETTFKSIEIGISQQNAIEGAGFEYVSWRDGTPLPVEFDPRALFDRLFSVELQPNTDQRDERLSILDSVLADAEALRGRLGATDAQRVEAHLDGLRAIEKRLSAEALSCTMPQAPASVAELQSGQAEPLLEVTDLMHELIAIAFACDLTRVFSLRFTAPVADTIFTEIGLTTGIHTITHSNDPDMYGDAVAFAIERFGDLVNRLVATPEGNGTLLDNCALLATTDLSDGYQHTVTDFPVVTAGTAGGALRTGFHYQGAGRNAAEVALTLLQACDVPVDAMGDGAALASSTIPELLA
jgi:hypothetical protein